MTRTRTGWSLPGLAAFAAAALLLFQAGCRREPASTAAVTQTDSAAPDADPAAALSLNPNIDLAGLPTVQISPLPPCGDAKKIDVLAQAVKDADSVHIDCSLTITAEDIRKTGRPITKRLIFDTSGATMDCGGAAIDGRPLSASSDDPFLMMEVNSKSTNPDPKTGLPRWASTQRVTIRHCRIFGRVKVYGAVGEPVENSGRADWVARVRSNAPRNIVFDDVTITAVQGSGDLLYLFSGVGNVQVLNSTITSEPNVVVKGVDVYLDSESYGNTFRNNRIEAQTDHREVMSLDGSSSNTIVDNVFSALNNGGIYLYRNCGESGVVRHSTPSNNQIVNNVFYYDKYTGPNPAIHVAQRNGTCCKDDCAKDSKFPFGSGISNYDHAQFNAVMQNQIIKRSFADMIKVGMPIVKHPGPAGIQTTEFLYDVNAPNFIDHNVTVRSEIKRAAGCYLSDGYPNFIQDGEFTNVFHDPNGNPVCRGSRMTCHDGALTRSNDATCQVAAPGTPRAPGQVGQMDFDCQATGSNNGCAKTVSLPAGAKIIGAKAACNLESGMVSSSDLDQTPAYIVNVVRASDVASQGTCTLGNTVAHSGKAGVSGVDGLNRVTVGCREQDSNGGDCDVKGRLYFR